MNPFKNLQKHELEIVEKDRKQYPNCGYSLTANTVTERFATGSKVETVVNYTRAVYRNCPNERPVCLISKTEEKKGPVVNVITKVFPGSGPSKEISWDIQSGRTASARAPTPKVQSVDNGNDSNTYKDGFDFFFHFGNSYADMLKPPDSWNDSYYRPDLMSTLVEKKGKGSSSTTNVGPAENNRDVKSDGNPKDGKPPKGWVSGPPKDL
jgi:hypothetical protein